MAVQVLSYWTYLQRTHSPGCVAFSVEVGKVNMPFPEVYASKTRRSLRPAYVFILLTVVSAFALAAGASLRADSISHARAEKNVIAMNVVSTGTDSFAQNAQAWAAVNRPAHRNSSRVSGPLSNLAQFNRTAVSAGESAAENAPESLLLLIAGCFSLLAYQGLRRYRNATTNTEK